jgi:hypothetical protein
MNAPASKPFNWRVFLLLTAGIIAAIVGMLIFRIATDSPPPPPKHDEESAEHPTPSEPEVDVQAVQEEAWRWIQPRLGNADERTKKATSALIGRIESFFESRKSGANAFAEAALGWGSKWELIKSREGHRKFIAEQFSNYIFSQKELATLLEQSANEYAQELKAVENEFLVQVRADLADLPPVALPAFSNESVLRSEFSKIVETVVAEVAQDLSIDVIDVGRAITSFAVDKVVPIVVTKTLTAVATRMGVSGAIIGTGAASSWATSGAGIVITIAVDALLDWIIGWFHDPVGDLAARVSTSLEDVSRSITTGDPEAWAVRNRVEEMTKGHSDQRLRTRAEEVLVSIEKGGALGLKHALVTVAELQATSRREAMRRLVYQKGR